jgi:hypothetical protein
MCFNRMVRVIGLLTVIASLLVGTASADGALGFRGWGLRGGLSVDPDQFFVGGHVDLGEFVDNLHFTPNVTVGFGDDITVFSINPDVYYSFPVEDVGSLYVGGLLAFQRFDYDSEYLDAQTEMGLHGIAGLDLGTVPVFFELNIGLDDTPDLKAAVGFTFPVD